MIIVTGAAGFIGSNLVKNYNKIGRADLFLVDNLNKYYKRENIKKLRYQKFFTKNEFIKKIEKNSFKKNRYYFSFWC